MRPSLGQSAQTLVATTDRLLYQAKQSGHNQIAYADSLVSEAGDSGDADAGDTDSGDLLHHSHT